MPPILIWAGEGLTDCMAAAFHETETIANRILMKVDRISVFFSAQKFQSTLGG